MSDASLPKKLDPKPDPNKFKPKPNLPKPPGREVPLIRDLNVLAPKFRSALERVLATLTGLGFDPMVIETIRTPERQTWLWGFGRTYDDGRGVVTGARTHLQTWHGYGLAADIISASKRWNAPLAFWEALGRECERQGLAWGGDWDGDGDWRDERFRDFPHVQWGKPMRQSPSAKARELIAQGGPPAVWRAVGAI